MQMYSSYLKMTTAVLVILALFIVGRYAQSPTVITTAIHSSTDIVDVPFASSIEAAKHRLSTAKKVMFGYGQNCCASSLKRLCENALTEQRFDECFQFNQSSLDPDWVSQHNDILKVHRGAGYWVWKPHLIHRMLTDDDLLQSGDYVVYMDAGAYPVQSLDDMFEFVEP